MRHPDGTYDLTVDDIHEIRERNYGITKNYTTEELIEYYKNKADEISKKYNLC